MRPIRYGIFAGLLLSLAAACSTSSRPKVETQVAPYQTLASERFRDTTRVTYLPNASNTYVLVRHQPRPTAQQPVTVTSYFVYDLGRQRVALEDSGLRGTVDWAGDYLVEVRLVPAVLKRGPQGTAEPQPSTYRLDVRTGERVPAGAEDPGR